MNFKQHNLMMYVEVESDLGENISSVQNITFFNHLILWDLGPCSRVGRRLLFVIIIITRRLGSGTWNNASSEEHIVASQKS